MMHSVVFGDGSLYPASAADHKGGQFKAKYDTYKDWFLIPASRPTVPPPGGQTKFVSIPGRDGDIDLSEWLRQGRPAYGNRSGSFSFYVENEHEFWMTIYPKIMNSLHGKTFKMVLEEDDPDYYYEGRFSVDSWKSEAARSTVTISYNLQPWKRRIRKVSERMIWDVFNFEQDYDYDPWGLGNIAVSGEKTYSLWGDGYPWQPEIKVLSGGPITVRFGGKTAEYLTTGLYSGSLGYAAYGPNSLKLTGTGTVSVDWRGGSL